MTDKTRARPPSLPELIEQLVLAAGTAQGKNEDERPNAIGGFFGASSLDGSLSAALYDEKVEEIAVEVMKALGLKNQFEGTAEIAEFIIDQQAEIDDETPDEQRWIRMAAALVKPQPRWHFEIEIPAVAPVVDVLSLAVDLGGGFSLAAHAPDRVALTGTVIAPTREAAIVRTERRLDEFLGLARVLGFSDFKQNRDRISDRHMYCHIAESHSDGLPIRPSTPTNDNDRLAALYADRIGGTRLIRPTNIDELRAAPGELVNAVGQRFRFLQRALTDNSEGAHKVRAACRLAMNAEDALDFGVLITLAFTCLEGLLLQDSSADVLARLREAVAYLLGSSFEEVERHRKLVKTLYELRSHFAHTGESIERGFFLNNADKAKEKIRGSRAQVMNLLFRVLYKEIEKLYGNLSASSA